MDDFRNVNKEKRGIQYLKFNDSEVEMDISYQSLPTSTGYTDENDEATMEEKINKLNIELEIAHNQVDNLILENSDLKKQINDYKKKIDRYKSVGIGIPLSNNQKTPLRFYSPQYKRRLQYPTMKVGLPRTSSRDLTLNTIIRNSPPKDGNKLDLQCSANIKTKHSPSLKTKFSNISTQSINDKNMDMATLIDCGIDEDNTTNDNLQRQSRTPQPRTLSNLQRNVEQMKPPKHRVMLFADQTGYGMRKVLQNCLGSTFIVTSIIKPHAPMSEILNSCADFCKDFTNTDFVIIMGGSNDTNPLKLQSVLYCKLNEMKHTNLLVGKIYKSKYLNVRMLNNLLKLTCDNCTNASYITMDTNLHDEVPYFMNKILASKILHKEMLHIINKINYFIYISKSRTKHEKHATVNDKYTQTDETSTTQQISLATSVLENNQSMESEQQFFRESQNSTFNESNSKCISQK